MRIPPRKFETNRNHYDSLKWDPEERFDGKTSIKESRETVPFNSTGIHVLDSHVFLIL